MNSGDRINLALIICLQLFALTMLWLASHSGLLICIISAILFSFAMLTNYSLLHEASHNNLNSRPEINRLLGTLAGCLFPVSFTFYTNGHAFHHMNNRSKHERFEYYDPDASWRSILMKHLQWYAIIIGTHWALIVFMNYVAATIPWVLKLSPFKKFTSTDGMFERLGSQQLQNITTESLLILVYWIILWNILDLTFAAVAISYTTFAFNWSSRQYVAHAFTPLDKNTGALNLKVSRFMERLLLYSNLHLLHHQHPDIPWHGLPELAKDQPTSSYFKHYLKLWTAPIPTPQLPV